MSHSRIFLVILTSSIAGLTHAADNAPLATPATASVAVPEPVGSYQLKHRSSFSPPDDARPPFWPVGFVKRGREVTVVRTARTNLSPEMFSLTSVVVGNPSLAIINGRAYGEGEFVRIGARVPNGTAPDSRPKIRVNRINDGQVLLQTPDGQVITVPLRRPELTERKADQDSELLLSGDR
jgi:hypothetical protein